MPRWWKPFEAGWRHKKTRNEAIKIFILGLVVIMTLFLLTRPEAVQ